MVIGTVDTVARRVTSEAMELFARVLDDFVLGTVYGTETFTTLPLLREFGLIALVALVVALTIGLEVVDFAVGFVVVDFDIAIVLDLAPDLDLD